MNTQEVLKSKSFPPFGRASKIAAVVIGAFLIAVVSFGAGVTIGLHKARFSYKFGENYERNFVGGPFQGEPGMMGNRGPRGMMQNFGGGGFRNGHGIAGNVVSISNSTVVLKDRNGQENNITVNDKTLIKRGQDTISLNDLKNDDKIVVIGQPGDNGTINADFIRVFDNVSNNNNNGQ